MTQPKADMRGEIEDEYQGPYPYDDDSECSYCGGSGLGYDCECGDDTCCCLEPILVLCSHCEGSGAQ